MLKYFLAWFPMLLLAILNGTLREFVFKKHVSDLTAHQLSTITLIILFAFYIAFIIQYYPPVSLTQAMRIGIMWSHLPYVLNLVLERQEVIHG